MTTPSTFPGGGESGATIAATFSDRARAHAALNQLHDAGFRTVWLGVTHGDASTAAGATVASDDAGSAGLMDSLGRFFSGDGAQEQALHKALISHGLSYEQAQRLEATVQAGAAIVTVDGENDPDEAKSVLEHCGGTIYLSSRQTSTPGAAAAAARATTVARDDVDDTRRLQLREERLLIDKQRVASGEARIRKDVVSEQQSIDVPVYHEQLFIQRRPAAAGTTASEIPMNAGEELRIPLSAEVVDVSKRTVVVEEVEIGKRKVDSTEHVSETVRHEELLVDDSSTASKTDPRSSGR